MNMSTLSEGLKILLKYDPDGTFDAQHDEIFFGPSDDIVSDEDKEALELLGFLFSDGEGWSCFT